MGLLPSKPSILLRKRSFSKRKHGFTKTLFSLFFYRRSLRNHNKIADNKFANLAKFKYPSNFPLQNAKLPNVIWRKFKG